MSKKKYKQGERIWSLEELERQEFVFFNGKVYHNGFWKSWQFRWVLERLKNGQLFKAERTDFVVFVCYEENRHELATENGAITDLCVKKNFSDAISWVYDRLKLGADSGFVVDKEAEELEDGDVSEAKLLDDIEKGIIAITMFSGYQENWDESYDIVVEVKEVE